jgi:hypothetical protein
MPRHGCETQTRLDNRRHAGALQRARFAASNNAPPPPSPFSTNKTNNSVSHRAPPSWPAPGDNAGVPLPDFQRFEWELLRGRGKGCGFVENESMWWTRLRHTTDWGGGRKVVADASQAPPPPFFVANTLSRASLARSSSPAWHGRNPLARRTRFVGIRWGHRYERAAFEVMMA